MATLIAEYNSEGCVGRCDARCHNAQGKVCDCICGGKNHGVGAAQAAQNTAEMAQELVDQAARDGRKVKVLPIQFGLTGLS